MLGRGAISGAQGLVGDGLRPGSLAPPWSVAGVPADGRWQLLVLTNHSLRAFPGVVEGIDWICGQPDAPAVTILTKAATYEATVTTIRALGLDVRIDPVPERTYWKFNVRVMPWMFFIDPD